MTRELPPVRVVSFLGQKGGVGKSALARLLAVAAADQGRKVLLADFDIEQLTCVHWSERRARAKIMPEIATRAFKSLKKLRKVEDHFDLVVADTRGLADGLARDLAKASDVVFLPTSASVDDLGPTVELGKRVAKKMNGGRVVVVLSKVGRSQRQLAAARDMLSGAGLEVLQEPWPLRDGIQTELDAGRVGLEAKATTPRNIARKTAGALLERVYGMAGKPQEPSVGEKADRAPKNGQRGA